MKTPPFAEPVAASHFSFLRGSSSPDDMVLAALAMGLANRVVPRGQSRAAAIALAQDLCRFPQATMRADRMNAYEQWGHPLPEALHGEWLRGRDRIGDALEGAGRFAAGEGRHGRF